MRGCSKSYDYIGKISNISKELFLEKIEIPIVNTMISLISSCAKTNKLKNIFVHEFILELLSMILKYV